jgi:hypothetical protein
VSSSTSLDFEDSQTPSNASYTHVSGSASAEVISFSQNKLLSTDDSLYAHQVEPTLAIGDDGAIFAGWKNSETHNGGGARVSFSRSTDGGTSWTSPHHMPMYNPGIPNRNHLPGDAVVTRQSDPWLVWFNGSIYYAYLEFSFSEVSFSQITIARSDNLGASWSRVKASYGRNFADKETMIVHEDGTVVLVYDDVDTSPNGEVTMRVSVSNDGGNTFHHTTTIGNPDEGHVAPYVTQSNQGDLFVASAWFTDSGGNLLLSTSDDHGDTFSEPRLINSDGNYSWWTDAGGRPSKISIPVIRFDQNDRLYVLWADTYNSTAHAFDVFLRYSDDYGTTWSNRTLINPFHIGDQWQPDFDIDSEGNLHIVYYDEQFELYKTFYRKVSISGEQRETLTLGSALPIAEEWTSNNFTRPGDYFTVRLDSEDVPHVVWTDGRDGKMDIYYANGVLSQPTTTEPAPTTTTTTITTTTATGGPNDTGLPQGDITGLFLGVGMGLSIVFVVVAIFLVSVKKRH